MLIDRLLKLLAVVASFGAYVILLMGTLVTNTNSGQGCGNSWPFCHGQIIPGTLTVAGIIEYSHRVVAGLEGFLVLVLVVGTWIAYRQDFRVKLFGAMSLLFVVLQGALGALTVVFEGTYMKNWILSVHFGLSLIAFASVVLLTVRLFQRTKIQQVVPTPGLKRLQILAWGLAAYTYIVVYTGALVVHSNALSGCGTEVPGCGSTYLPNVTTLAGIQVLHRYGAGLLWFAVLGFLLIVLRSYRERRDVVRGAWWALILVTLQAVAGLSTVVTGGQMLAGLLHATLISVFFAVLSYLCVQLGWPWKRSNVSKQVDSSQQMGVHPAS